MMHEVERRLRVTEPVIKFLTVREDEEQKRLDKIKKLRDAKKKASAQPAAAAAAAAIRHTGCSGSRSGSDARQRRIGGVQSAGAWAVDQSLRES